MFYNLELTNLGTMSRAKELNELDPHRGIYLV